MINNIQTFELEHYRIHMPKLTNIMVSSMTVLSTIRNDLLHQFINKAIVSFFKTDFDRVLLQLVAITLRTLCLNTEWGIGTWCSSVKHMSCWWKALQNLIRYLSSFNVQLYVHFKKYTLKFKLLYLFNHISYFNKSCRICCLNTHIQSLKVLYKSVPPRLKYRIFSRGLFLMVHPVDHWHCHGALGNMLPLDFQQFLFFSIQYTFCSYYSLWQPCFFGFGTHFWFLYSQLPKTDIIFILHAAKVSFQLGIKTRLIVNIH